MNGGWGTQNNSTLNKCMEVTSQRARRMLEEGNCGFSSQIYTWERGTGWKRDLRGRQKKLMEIIFKGYHCMVCTIHVSAFPLKENRGGRVEPE